MSQKNFQKIVIPGVVLLVVVILILLATLSNVKEGLLGGSDQEPTRWAAPVVAVTSEETPTADGTAWWNNMPTAVSVRKTATPTVTTTPTKTK